MVLEEVGRCEIEGCGGREEKREEINRWRISAVAVAVEWWMLGSPDKGVHMA